jgi:hypothetical protein
MSSSRCKDWKTKENPEIDVFGDTSDWPTAKTYSLFPCVPKAIWKRKKEKQNRCKPFFPIV